MLAGTLEELADNPFSMPICMLFHDSQMNLLQARESGIGSNKRRICENNPRIHVGKISVKLFEYFYKNDSKIPGEQSRDFFILQEGWVYSGIDIYTVI